MSTIVEVNDVSRRFKIREKLNRARGFLERLKVVDSDLREIWALKDVSLEVKKGEWLGIIGENGSGKTTLLKIIGNILEPSEGEVKTGGKIASILGLGTGFKGELTARENLYLYCSLMGLDEEEIDRKYEDIVSFAGLYDYMNTKIKKFSDGMRTRLAFATAMHVDADIILSDEVLTVGDGEFQNKCLEKMEELKQEGKTIIFASHDLNSVKEWCDRAILLKDGEVKRKGDVEEVISEYREFLTWKGRNEELRSFKAELKDSESPIFDFKLFDEEDKESYIFRKGDSVEGEVKLDKKYNKLRLDFKDETSGDVKLSVHTKNLKEIEEGYKANFSIDPVWLDKGDYKLSLFGDNDKIIEIEVEVLPDGGKLPEKIVVEGPGNEGKFPEGKFYVFGKDEDLDKKFIEGEGVTVCHSDICEDLKNRYDQGYVFESED